MKTSLESGTSPSDKIEIDAALDNTNINRVRFTASTLHLELTRVCVCVCVCVCACVRACVRACVCVVAGSFGGHCQ